MKRIYTQPDMTFTLYQTMDVLTASGGWDATEQEFTRSDIDWGGV